MARLYADENFAFPVVSSLRQLGHDVLTTQEAGRSEQAIPDNEVLQFACDENRAVLTFNRKHFIRLHQEMPEHHGIIVCTYDHNFAAQSERIHAAIMAQADISRLLLRVNRPLY